MKISTLSIGDELIFGEVLDTNSAHVAARLYDLGIKVQRHLLVGDNEPDIMDSIETLAEKCDAVIVTGGLGPTSDDLTSLAAAKVTGRRLIVNDEALSHMREFSGREGEGFHAATDRQALLPAKSTIIPNPTGTACGFIITWNGRYLFFLPGVPSEMARMLDDTVVPFIQERRHQKTTILTKTFTLFGIAEADIDPLISDVSMPEDGLTVSFRVRFPVVDVKLRVEGERETSVAESLEKGSADVRERLKDFIVAEDGATLGEEVSRLFREKGVTVALAESCTGGLISKRLTDVAGSSAYFLEGMVVYSNDAKTRVLKVPAELISDKGAVSAEVATAMAQGARKGAGSDVALAVTGVAGPGATDEKPAGTVFIALADRTGCTVKEYHFSGDRRQVRKLTAFTALDGLRRYLLAR